MRRRYVYREDPETKQVRAYEVGEEWSDAPRPIAIATEGIVYNNLQATDGTDLSSRAKHRNYMKQNGLTMNTDYSPEWKAKRNEERANLQTSRASTEARKHAIARSLEIHRRRK